MSTTGEIHQRDGHRCARCGKRSESVQHRIHGDRTDNRASNLVALCGDGTQGCHGWCESHRRDARTLGWEVSKYRRQDTTEITVYYVNHPLSPGRPAWIRLRDDLTAELAEYA